MAWVCSGKSEKSGRVEESEIGLERQVEDKLGRVSNARLRSVSSRTQVMGSHESFLQDRVTQAKLCLRKTKWDLEKRTN